MNALFHFNLPVKVGLRSRGITALERLPSTSQIPAGNCGLLRRRWAPLAQAPASLDADDAPGECSRSDSLDITTPKRQELSFPR